MTARVLTFDQVLEEYAKERGNEEWRPIRTGWPTIDAELRGISAGQVLGIAARTAVGKTWALNSIAHVNGHREEIGQGILSLEMPAPEWVERQLAIAADVPPEQVERWAREKELGQRAHDVGFLEHFARTRIVEDSVALNSLGQVIGEMRSQLDPIPLRLLLIDYLGLLGAGGPAYERASLIGRTLKQCAKAEKVAIVVATQLSRAGGDGSDAVTLDMLRDSGVIEESLDFLLGAWRPDKAAEVDPMEALELRGVMRVQILKNRKGEDGRRVDLTFRPESRRLVEETSLA